MFPRLQFAVRHPMVVSAIRTGRRHALESYAAYKTLSIQRRGKVLEVKMNRPDKLNAVSATAHNELSRVFNDIAADSESQLVLLTGAGKAFSAGGDLDLMEELRGNVARFNDAIREAKRIVFSMLDCDKPIVCKVNGDAIGLGATIALFCDVTIAVETARFADPHNAVGLCTGDGGAIIWPQLIGFARAKHFLLTGERISAVEAAQMGLIYRAVPADQLDQVVDSYMASLEALPAQSLRWTKATINIPLKQLAHSLMDAGMAYEALGSATDDHAEAISAFRGRRKPSFTDR